MHTLPATITAAIANRNNHPITQVELHFEDSTVRRISNYAHTYDGNNFLAELRGDVKIKQGIGAKFNDCTFSVENYDGTYRDIFNAYTGPELEETIIYIYELDYTSIAATERLEIFRGKLSPPKNLKLKTISLKAIQRLNTIKEQFNRAQFSPVCFWQQRGLFDDGERCNYSALPGTSRTMIGDIDDVTTSVGEADPVDRFSIGDYIKIDSEVMKITNLEDPPSPPPPVYGTITVDRAQKGTSAASHTSGAKIYYYSCPGGHDDCKLRGMAHRFGGLVYYPTSGVLYWREKILWVLSRKIVQRWESHWSDGIFGTPWGVVYGGDSTYGVRVNLKSCYVRDPGSYAVGFAIAGAGAMEGPVQPPARYGTSGESANSYDILINEKPVNHYNFFEGNDGQTGMDSDPPTYHSDDIQRYSYLWANEPDSYGNTASSSNGQTFSKLAYFVFTYPSDVKQDEALPESVAYMKGLKLPQYDTDGNVTTTEWTNNPAWIFIDILTNKYYGAGISLSDIDYAKMVTAAAAFTTASRSFSYHFTEKMKLADVAQLICDATLSIPTFDDNKIGLEVLISTKSATGLSFGEDDVKEDTTTYMTKGPMGRDGNVLEFDIISPDHDFQSVPVAFRDEDHITAMGGREKKISKKLVGITSLSQAEEVGAFWMNVVKQSRRQDGAKDVTMFNQCMALQPGDIFELNVNTIDGQGAINYLVWDIERANNNGERKFNLLKWDSGLFDTTGINYETPGTMTNPLLDPLDVENLASSITNVGDDKVRIEITWDWPSDSPPTPNVKRVFLHIGNTGDALSQFDQWTPQGAERPVNEWQKIIPRDTFDDARVFAVSQSVFGVPANPVPRYMPDTDNQTTLDGDLTATAYQFDVDSAAALNVTAGEFLIFALDQAYEIVKYVSAAGDTLTVEQLNSERLTYFGTEARTHADGAAIYKLTFNAPYTDLSVMNPVKAIDYIRAYDYTTDTSLASNQIRVKIPIAATGAWPKFLHIQLHESTPFPEPTEDPTGADDAELITTFGTSVLVPTAYDMSAAAGKLMVLTPDTTARMGRYIDSVDNGITYEGATFKRANLSGYMPRMEGRYDWAVWSLWYTSCWHHLNVTMKDQHIDTQSNLFDIVFTVDKTGSVYLRGYFLTDASYSDGVIATDEVGGANTLLTLSNMTDPDVPGPPTGINAFCENMNIHVSWTAPTSNIATLSGYIVRISNTSQYGGSSPNWTLAEYIETETSAGETCAIIPVFEAGEYAIGVVAVNMIGESTMAILYQEA